MYTLSAVVLAATIFGGSAYGNPAQVPDSYSTSNNSSIIIQQIRPSDFEDLKTELNKWGFSFDCPTIDWPDNTLPDIELPDFNLPDNNNPDSNHPETNFPDIESPDNNQGTNSSYIQRVVDLVNEERTKIGLQKLQIAQDVTAAAQVRAKEISSSFSHTRPNGSHFTTALSENGVSYRGAGENIAWGQQSPEAVMNTWMNSDGHRANILNKNFTTIGVGYYVGNDGRQYWTQLFTN